MPDNRATAVQILFQTFSRRSFLDFEPMNGLSPAGRSFVKMLVMTTVRRYEFIRKVIRQFARKNFLPRQPTPNMRWLVPSVNCCL